MKFLLPQGAMLTKTKKKKKKEKKKKRKKMKFENFENKTKQNKKKKNNRLVIQQRGSYPQNLAWIHAAVSEKPEFTYDGRTDGRTNDGRLRHDSSSADKVKQSYKRHTS